MLSVVIPVFNEDACLEPLWDELCRVAATHNYQLEILFVDDGSTDRSWSAIRSLTDRDGKVRGIRLRRNFGKAEALSAGFAAARGQAVITMDADGQDDPADIPKFLDKMAEGYDVVSGWKRVRRDPWSRVAGSRVFNWLVGRLTGVHLHDHNCGYKCCRREILHEFRLYGELHRFIPVMAAARGFRVGEVVVNHRPRTHGKSKYGVRRIPKGLLDLMTVKFVTGFGRRPQHLLGMVGLVGFALGSVGICLLVAWWFLSRWSVVTEAFPGVTPIHLHERAVFYLSLTALLLGSQFMSIGLLAELIVAFQIRHDARDLVAERAGFPGADEPATVVDKVTEHDV
jgi:dolichol-phosphate mannosyltransferase